MIEKINGYLEDIKKRALQTEEEIENFRIEFLGRQGVLKDLREDFKEVPGQLKREVGIALNTLKGEIEGLIKTSKGFR